MLVMEDDGSKTEPKEVGGGGGVPENLAQKGEQTENRTPGGVPFRCGLDASLAD